MVEELRTGSEVYERLTFLQTELASSPNWRHYLSQAVALKTPSISGQIALHFVREEVRNNGCAKAWINYGVSTHISQ